MWIINFLTARTAPASSLPQAFTPAPYTLSDIKRSEYERDISRHEQSLSAREKQIANLIADQKDEMAVLKSIRTAQACLVGPEIEAKVEKLLAEEIEGDIAEAAEPAQLEAAE